MVAVALVALYVALPWWVPEHWLARRVGAALTSRLGLPVTVGRVELSWTRGVSLRDLRVTDRAGRRIAAVDLIRTELSPVRMLLGGGETGSRLGWLECSGLRLRSVLAGSEKLPSAFGELVEQGLLPERLAVRDATVVLPLRWFGAGPPTFEFRVFWPGPGGRARPEDRRRELLLKISDLQFVRGRLTDLGRVTMSAVVVQDGGGCPVTVIAAASRDNPVAKCSFRFSGLDLAQLDLPGLLALPLKRVAGTARGQLECQLDSDGTVERLDFSLEVEHLDAQPMAGGPLPTIERAEISASAQYDWYTKDLRFQAFRLRLPGLDLAGSGRLHAGVLTGGWEGLHSLEMSGTINPASLAALLRGQGGPLPGGVRVDGAVGGRLSVRGERDRLSLSVVLNATAAVVRVGGRVAKPAGRKLTAELRGSLSRRTWRFALDQTELRIGQNRFSSSGAMENLRRSLSRYLEADRPGGPGAILAELAGLNWRGSWEIRELRSLRDLLGWDVLEKVRLRGRLTGHWSLENTGEVLLRCRAFAPVETELSWEGVFRKPPKVPLRVEFSGDLAPAGGRLERVSLWAGVGEAGLNISDARVAFSSVERAGVPALSLQAQGRYAVRDLARLLACMPPVAKWAECLTGGADGSFDLVLAPPARRLYLQANLTRLGASAGEAFIKSAGRPAELTADIRSDPALPAAVRSRVEMGLKLGPAQLAGALRFGPAGGGAALRCSGQLRVADAAWLVQLSPALQRRLKPLDVRGAMNANFRLRSEGKVLSGEIDCDADELQFRLPGLGGVKARGTACRLRLDGRAAPGLVSIGVLAVDWGRSSVRLSGTVTPAGAGGLAGPVGGKRYWPPPGVRGVDLKLRGVLAADRALRSLLPVDRKWLRGSTAKGALRFEVALRGGEKGLSVRGGFEDAELSLVLGSHLRKSVRDRLAGRIDLFLPAGLDRLEAREACLDAGVLHLSAKGSVSLLQPGALGLKLAGEVKDLGGLSRFLPALAAYELAGRAAFELDYRRGGGRDVIRSARLTLRGLSAMVRGQPCRLDGSVVLGDVGAAGAYGDLVALVRALVAGRAVGLEDLAIAELQAGQLGWSVGRSGGFVVARLSELPRRPRGRVVVLCSELDVPELAAWAAAAAAPMEPGELTEAQRAELARRASELIAQGRRLLASADVRLLLRSDRLWHFDPAVRAFYEVQDLEATAVVKAGRVRAAYRCGLNGGRMSCRFALDLRADHPRLAMEGEVEKVLSGRNILLQLAREFPGNTVFGTFSRTMNVTYPLRAVVMSLLDGRYPLRPVGTARTVTEDGLLRGRGGPKFITSIFPGLNLATYRYRRMVGFAEYRPDGTAVNDMIFDGVGYNIYIEGTTDAHHIGRYEIGVLLLASPQSPETLHRFRQGRIPILKFRARIENGRFYDEKVILVRPDEAAYKIFLENNIFYRLWREAGRQRRPVRLLDPTEDWTPAGPAP